MNGSSGLKRVVSKLHQETRKYLEGVLVYADCLEGILSSLITVHKRRKNKCRAKHMDSSLRTNDADQTRLGIEVMTHMEKSEGCDLIR